MTGAPENTTADQLAAILARATEARAAGDSDAAVLDLLSHQFEAFTAAHPNGVGPTAEEEHESDIDRRYLQLASATVDAPKLGQLPKPSPLIEGIIFRNTINWLGGKPGHYKSIAALDWSCCIATDLPWHGHSVTAGNVLYVVAEGAHGMDQRRQAWEHVNGRTVPAGRLSFLPVAVQLWKGDDTAAVAQLANDLDPILIVLDTQSRVTVGAEENSSRDMGRFVDSLEQLRSATSACLLTLHHEPRNAEHLRGSSAMEGAATTIMRVSLDGRVVTLNCTKQKDAAAVAAINLLPETVPLGDSPDSSSVAYSHEPVRGSDLTGDSEALVLKVLRESFESSGASATQLLKASGLTEPTFYRARTSLVNKGLIINTGTKQRSCYILAGNQETL
jgi:hypothetical protein